MAEKIGHASISEKGTIRGEAGDQNGKEVFTRNWYKHSKGWVLVRCIVPGMAEHIAKAMELACANDDIGYDQSENQTLWDNIENRGFDPSRTTKKVETDCARLVRVCVQYAYEKMGISGTCPDFYTATLASKLVSTGYFKKLTASKYVTQDDYLMRGDILVTKTKGHTVVVLTNGDKAKAEDIIETEFVEKEYKLGERILKLGCEGNDVKELQSLLLQLGYNLGKWGADGEYGESTEIAVTEFQKENNCEVDGEVGEETLKAIDKAFEGSDQPAKNARFVMIENGDCYIRTAPSKESGRIIGIARENDIFPYGGETSSDGWLLIEAEGKNGWVSGMYGELVKE